MNKLDYNGQEWQGTLQNDYESLYVSLSDAIFQKHLNAYLERTGVPTMTYLELIAFVERVCEQRYQAAQHISKLEYWRNCDDPGVRIFHLTYAQMQKQTKDSGAPEY